jgi:TatD DNase family protein
MVPHPVLFDTHVHFPCGDAPFDLGATLGRAAAAGVGRLLAVGADEEMNALAIEAAIRFPERVVAAVGLERGWADRHPAADVAAAVRCLESTVRTGRAQGAVVAAIGETGLDFHYAPQTAPVQRELFAAQLALARRLALPVVVHSRDADEATLEHLVFHAAAATAPGGPGVLHCFTGTRAFADRLLDLGYSLSFSGILTFHTAAALRAVAATIPEDRILIETDAPYLAPVPLRGQRNEPAYLPHVAACLARLRGWTPDQAAAVTTRNALRLFGASAPAAAAGPGMPG